MRNPFKKLDMAEVVEYLKANSKSIDMQTAEKILEIIVKSPANKIQFYRVEK